LRTCRGVRELLRQEEVPVASAEAFYTIFSGGNRQQLYQQNDNVMFIRGVSIVDEIDKVGSIAHYR
jgi:hypothetical protein